MKATHSIVLFLTFFISFLLLAPYTVQTGDTGELVANSFFFNRSHPPGYPLFHILQYIVLHSIPFGTVFFRASILSVFLSSLIMLLLFVNFKNIPLLLRLSFLLILGSSAVYWKYSLLPDVFLLHGFILITFSIFYFKESNKLSIIGLFSVFGLGIANHHTTIFLLPLVLYKIWQSREKRQLLVPLGMGCLLTILLYLSLLIFRNNLISSWGEINSVSDFFHFLFRMDYGTWQLTTAKSSPQVYLIFLSFIKAIFLNFHFYFLVLFFLWGLNQASGRKFFIFTQKESIYLLTILLYCVLFFYKINLDLEKHHFFVIERFYLHPMLMLAFYFMYMLNKYYASFDINKNRANAILVVFLICFGFNLKNNFQENNYSKNTIIEDYAHNLLLPIADTKKSILLVETDTEYASLLYVQNVLNYKSDVIVIVPQLLAYDWYVKKIKQKSNFFQFDITSAEMASNGFSLRKDVIEKNINNFDFYFIPNYSWQQGYRITFLPIGKKIEKGNGIIFSHQWQDELMIRSQFLSETNKYSIEGDLFSRYAHMHLHEGNHFFRDGKYDLALRSFERALELVPYCIPAVQNICLLKKNSKEYCEGSIRKIQTTYYPYL